MLMLNVSGHALFLGSAGHFDRRVQLLRVVPGQRTPGKGHVDRAGDQIVEQLGRPIAIAVRIEEQRIRREVIEQAAPGQAFLDRRVRVDADPEPLQLRRVERRDRVPLPLR